MKKDITLIVMAAGMGSRFGGLKQIEPVGKNGECNLNSIVFTSRQIYQTNVCGFHYSIILSKSK